MNLTKYVDKLPIPSVLSPKAKINLVTYYEITMQEVMQQLHSELPPTKVWGYEGTYPGPTIEAAIYEKVRVKYINDLPMDKHLLPVDMTIHGADHGVPMVRTVVHLHGGHVAPEYDGHPDAWFTRNFEQVGSKFEKTVYEYPNIQEATTLWYHDHAVGITRLNVYAGLAGFYIIRHKCEERLNLPKGNYEIPMVIQDRSFNDDGSLFYPTQPDPPVSGVDPSIVPEFFGDTILVNGKVWPYLEVEPRKYRFRILNGSNSRFYSLQFDTDQVIWLQIGTDGGFLERPVRLNQLILAPAERADVIIDFSKASEQNIILVNDAPTPFPNGVDPNPKTTGQIMQFRVTLPLSSKDTSSIPKYLNKVEKLEVDDAVKVRDLSLRESTDNYGRLFLLLTGRRWDYPITEKPQLNSTEIWRFINLTMDTHPMHLHLVQFQILDCQPFDVDYYNQTAEIRFTGPPQLPALNERGWKDTVRANPGQITRVIARFEDFSGDYVWHCHILEHEDHEMMRPYEVVNICKKKLEECK